MKFDLKSLEWRKENLKTLVIQALKRNIQGELRMHPVKEGQVSSCVCCWILENTEGDMESQTVSSTEKPARTTPEPLSDVPEQSPTPECAPDAKTVLQEQDIGLDFNALFSNVSQNRRRAPRKSQIVPATSSKDNIVS